MIAQYAAASLVSENKVLAHPAGVDSIPTSSNVEDHVAMATIAARHARLVNENASHVVAIEILAALQALDIRQKEHAVPPEALLSDSARAVRTAVRTGTADVARIDSLFDGDRVLWPDISALRQALIAGHLLRLALHPIGRP
jgi:histidine ammonia-lyase